MKKLLFLMIPIFGAYLTINGLWAEPSPEPVRASPAFTVEIGHKAEANEIELEVESMTEGFDKQIDLLARCVEAEAGNQSLLGKRLVVDVILNRVASPDFPDGIEAVINQPGQFGVVSNGAIDKAVPSEETIQAVTRELNERIDTEVLYFQTSNYSKFGTPFDKVGDHYFSK